MEMCVRCEGIFVSINKWIISWHYIWNSSGFVHIKRQILLQQNYIIYVDS